jgi:hypothetical protein
MFETEPLTPALVKEILERLKHTGSAYYSPGFDGYMRKTYGSDLMPDKVTAPPFFPRLY